jgi:hypothetical protein
MRPGPPLYEGVKLVLLNQVKVAFEDEFDITWVHPVSVQIPTWPSVACMTISPATAADELTRVPLPAFIAFSKL